GASANPAISADGRYVVFESEATNWAGTADNNGASDVFVHDTVTATTTRVSVNVSGTEGNGASSLPSISGDGNLVAYQSLATNLVAGTDSNGRADIFVFDRATGATTRVSVNASGTAGNGESKAAA